MRWQHWLDALKACVVEKMEATEEALQEIPTLVSECMETVNSNDHFKLQQLQRQVHVIADLLAVLIRQLIAVRPSVGQICTVV